MRRFRALATLLCAFALSACTYLHPAFGELPEGERQRAVEASPNYRDGQFQNQVDTPMRTNAFTFIFAVIKGYFEPRERPRPAQPLPTVKTDLAALPRTQDTIVWLGHSSFFVQLGGRRLLIDPVFSTYAAPFPWMVKAFDGTSLYDAREIPEVDYILITHDHYDHLDYASMKALEPKARHIIAGLGVGAHFEHWGYSKAKLREADWNTAIELDPGIKIHVLPARHYSGRFMKRNQSLWVSFAVETAGKRLFFSGDTGFGPHFQQIADRFDDFDLVALDSGQYNPRWANIHMNPEEASQAAEILRARQLLVAHAGRFSLARHPWDEPFIRAEAASRGKRYRLLTPRIGEPINLDAPPGDATPWWRGLD